jgi:hypothetical protein
VRTRLHLDDIIDIRRHSAESHDARRDESADDGHVEGLRQDGSDGLAFGEERVPMRFNAKLTN